MVKNKLKEGDELEVQEKEKLRNNYQGTTDNCKYLKEIPQQKEQLWFNRGGSAG